MDYEAQVKYWIRGDEERLRALNVAAELNLNDWCLAAGFVRNLIWDKLHGKSTPTPLNDIDLIYFNRSDTRAETDLKLEAELQAKADFPWSVKNQARMHLRNQDSEYSSSTDAMSYWVEVETAIGIRLTKQGELELIAPFGCRKNFDHTITINRKRPKAEDFKNRLETKGWQKTWPKLVV